MNFRIENFPKKEAEPIPQFEIKRENSLEFIAQSISNYEDVGDEEAIFMLALTLNHPEMKDEIFRQIEKYKPHVQNPEKILTRIQEEYLTTKQEISEQTDEEDNI